jgi:hypothetical protein
LDVAANHAATEGITWWNLPDGGAAPGEDKVCSGLLFDDMRPKPACLALHDLIHREWRTQVEGCFRFRGFHGTYAVRTGIGVESALTL